ncbi:MAG: hypothetical protein KDJ16_17620, partial [Hyphomicrobiales bacterium]|nr:hypothetical protein [Hyphomicrobiales bacterium]
MSKIWPRAALAVLRRLPAPAIVAGAVALGALTGCTLTNDERLYVAPTAPAAPKPAAVDTDAAIGA